MHKQATNHVGMALFVLTMLTGFLLWLTGALHFGSAAAPAAATHAEVAGGEGGEHAGEAAPHEGPETREADMSAVEKMKCEHEIPVLECDECRYETGVSKVEPSVAAALLTTAKAEEREVTLTLNLTGQVQYDATRVVDVSSVGTGKITSIRKLLGDRVAKDDVLAVIRSKEFGEAKAAFLEAKARRELAATTKERERQLFEGKIASEADYLSAVNELQRADAALAAAEKHLHVFGLDARQVAEIDTARDNGSFADLVLTAPRDGAVTAQNAAEGKFIDEAQALFTIADLTNVWVWCDLYERDLAPLHTRLASGQPVDAMVRVAAFREDAFPGRIDLIGSEIDAHTRTVKVRVQVPNADGKLKPGMFATVDVAISSGERALLVPENAVLHDEGQAFVFEHWKEDFWVRRDVTAGRDQRGMTEIVKGLRPGATVVAGGGFMLKGDVLRAKMGAGCAD